MFSRILIANRGEIALRIIRTCRELGIETVVVYSEADRDADYLEYADYGVCIGPATGAESYLNIPRIISAAEVTDVEAIHPGCGFLAENAHFAEVCKSSNIKFIGPAPRQIELFGDKASAVKLARENKVPTIPGSNGAVETDEQALEAARRIGYPVLVKAVAGGGGKGIRVAHNDISLVNALFIARREAQAAFKDSSIYVEKFIDRARHIEVQVMGDEHGNVIHLGMRDCSVQRRYQKLIEEAPVSGLRKSLEEAICKAAVKLARSAGYASAGTAEFLLDRQGRFYFTEMNARLQVEHPVTEMITGLDLVQMQLAVASGERLKLRQKQVEFRGWAIECRINAEDPDDNFRPSPGKIDGYCTPGGPNVRIDSHVYPGYTVSPHYDPMISKVICYGKRRNEALACMRRALDEYRIEGIKTTIPLQRIILADSDFSRGGVHTRWLESRLLEHD